MIGSLPVGHAEVDRIWIITRRRAWSCTNLLDVRRPPNGERVRAPHGFKELTIRSLGKAVRNAEPLLKLRLTAPYNRETDWVFASPTMKGKQPLWSETLWRRYGRPAVKAVKIQKRVGFHTFRHTYTTLLTQNNEEVKVVQELLRHANSRITLDLYAQAGMPNKRLAQSKLVRMVLNKGEALA
jgi:integrase